MGRLLSFPILLIVVTIFLQISNSMSSSLIHKTCKSTIDKKFCIDTLDSDPRTANADLVSLANISLDLTLRNATDTREYISHLLENATDPVMKKWLNGCLKSYGGALAGIRDASRDIASKDYESMVHSIQIGGSQPLICEQSFGEKGHKSPLNHRNNDVNRLSNIVGAIASILMPPDRDD
ncbi:putative invertase inhibitor [Magnolia sinica]|uniref:putative invertase inhibitor n=1 Tax=Magnolia sinica TaxID=86752 RepID=UPI00265AC816|nr:putative invertase inhibitor [Magnolia sinica]